MGVYVYFYKLSYVVLFPEVLDFMLYLSLFIHLVN